MYSTNEGRSFPSHSVSCCQGRIQDHEQKGVGSMVNLRAVRSIELAPSVIPIPNCSQNNHNPSTIPTFWGEHSPRHDRRDKTCLSLIPTASPQSRSAPRPKIPIHQHPNTVDEQLLHPPQAHGPHFLRPYKFTYQHLALRASDSLFVVAVTDASGLIGCKIAGTHPIASSIIINTSPQKRLPPALTH